MTYFTRYVETAVCKGHESDSFKISVCKSCLKPGFTAGMCPTCGIKNWIGKNFLKNDRSIRKIENWFGIPHGQFIPIYKQSVLQFKLETLVQFIKSIMKEEFK